ncbi:hypothetical protein P301_E11996 [Saccharomyces cerevisiae P301]|uniref:Putative uncharacterized protein YER172C-A n=2 Tax=Saccharomyces cerevisiae TaxID=4932 RepID=YE172_YEAST|nr:RecName: Full=Putative uncharacterized protein YER172C-A [Saccharomyces cerevisiae S288C]pir/S30858/ hypothetical protein YER172c-a - yeast (Saccharomyces cerevisiae) [Saccharomyces cerevisiae]EWG86672.1 hypothetical protein R008_E12011 [Saccharomyces cerevisiae R008]EWG91560.1 hypothetical protein P301_E11996 [Saccharomyces cerevisiae P301]WNV72615.1 hypothetical protein O6U65_0931 [Saccharomyces cerevisiae synthetic construct]CAY79361.1 EC1118_1E8_3224p [Saccharomyces cerevisiae EC1118]A
MTVLLEHPLGPDSSRILCLALGKNMASKASCTSLSFLLCMATCSKQLGLNFSYHCSPPSSLILGRILDVSCLERKSFSVLLALRTGEVGLDELHFVICEPNELRLYCNKGRLFKFVLSISFRQEQT